MPKSGFAAVLLLIILGMLSAVSFLIAFKKFPIQIGTPNTPQETQQEGEDNTNPSQSQTSTDSASRPLPNKQNISERTQLNAPTNTQNTTSASTPTTIQLTSHLPQHQVQSQPPVIPEKANRNQPMNLL